MFRVIIFSDGRELEAVYNIAAADRARLSYVMLKILTCLEQCYTSLYG